MTKKVLPGILVAFLPIVFINSQTTVTFILEDLPLAVGQNVGIRGNIPPLDWSKSIPLEKVGQNYTVELNFTASAKDLEFKFVLFTNDQKPIWENIQNRTLTLKGNLRSENKWNQDQIVDIKNLGLIDTAGLLKDFELIQTMVLDVHPGTYRYNSQDQIQAALEALKNRFSSPITHQEAYLAISKVTAQLKCDHTRAGFNNQGKVINSIIHYQPDKMPFTFRWVHDEMIILQNASGNDLLKRGSKVLSINEVPVLEIRNKMVKYIGGDGATDKNRIYKTQINGFDFRYNAFDIFYPLLYPLTNSKITLEIQLPNQKRTTLVQVSPLTREERFKRLAERYETFPKTRDDLWTFTIRSDSIAILTLNSFGLSGWKAMTIDYKAFLAKAFKQINQQDIKHLIIDIRENTGGNDEMAEELFKYLAEYNFQVEREGRTRYITFPESLKPHIRTWGDNPWYFNLNPDNKEPLNGYYSFKENFSQARKKNNKSIFKGKSYLLTSAANTSLAFYTAYRSKYQNIGLLIGQETGGNLNDINGGQILFLTLPHSNIEIDFPVMGGFTPQKQPNTGVIPDVKVDYNLEAVMDQRDLEMEKVLELIKQ